eukprot:766553-Hanusia_phi.AAC.3
MANKQKVKTIQQLVVNEDDIIVRGGRKLLQSLERQVRSAIPSSNPPCHLSDLQPSPIINLNLNALRAHVEELSEADETYARGKTCRCR